jgi:ubiquinone biosynthesis accessory factor UbiJ
MFTHIVTASLNRLAGKSEWARHELRAHSGKSVRFSIESLMDLNVTIKPDGRFFPLAKYAKTDVTLIITPEILHRLVANDIHAFREILVSGDQSLTETILYMGRTLHGEIENDLSLFLGDVLAHQAAQSGRRLIQWQIESAQNISQALAEFLTEEKPVVVSRTQLHHRIAEIDTLQQRVSRLEAKIHQLSVSQVSTQQKLLVSDKPTVKHYVT